MLRSSSAPDLVLRGGDPGASRDAGEARLGLSWRGGPGTGKARIASGRAHPCRLGLIPWRWLLGRIRTRAPTPAQRQLRLPALASLLTSRAGSGKVNRTRDSGQPADGGEGWRRETKCHQGQGQLAEVCVGAGWLYIRPPCLFLPDCMALITSTHSPHTSHQHPQEP